MNVAPRRPSDASVIDGRDAATSFANWTAHDRLPTPPPRWVSNDVDVSPRRAPSEQSADGYDGYGAQERSADSVPPEKLITARVRRNQSRAAHSPPRIRVPRAHPSSQHVH